MSQHSDDLSSDVLPSSITPEAIEIINKLPAIHYDPVLWMSPLDEPIVLPYEVARIVQACLVVHANIFDADSNTERAQWCFLREAHHEAESGLLHLHYMARNSLSRPSESYPIMAEPLVSFYARFTLRLPAKMSLPDTGSYLQAVKDMATELHGVAMTSEISRRFEDSEPDEDPNSQLDYAGLCDALHMLPLPMFVMGFDNAWARFGAVHEGRGICEGLQPDVGIGGYCGVTLGAGGRKGSAYGHGHTGGLRNA
ncbi:hypothetical protein BDZ89DRAFT_1057929, partial [Hymenopellis radicata]